ncbi:MAG: hypothetical protein CMO80_15320 [Verrucomicrobiales bacterium]|nr:hypothetical protein [Verrucomicrobiales bacterium]
MSEPDTSPTAAPEPQPTGIRWSGVRKIVGVFVCLFLLVWVGSKIADDETFVGTALTACCPFGGLGLAIW